MCQPRAPFAALRSHRRVQSAPGLLRSVRSRHVDEAILIPAGHVDAPWIAAHLAVLNEAAMDVRLDVDFHLLAAERTADQELVWHLQQSYRTDLGLTFSLTICKIAP